MKHDETEICLKVYLRRSSQKQPNTSEGVKESGLSGGRNWSVVQSQQRRPPQGPLGLGWPFILAPTEARGLDLWILILTMQINPKEGSWSPVRQFPWEMPRERLNYDPLTANTPCNLEISFLVPKAQPGWRTTTMTVSPWHSSDLLASFGKLTLPGNSFSAILVTTFCGALTGS